MDTGLEELRNKKEQLRNIPFCSRGAKSTEIRNKKEHTPLGVFHCSFGVRSGCSKQKCVDRLIIFLV